jgi:4-amino-4-deoxy-L-arabinose transferase-like glycosyltransferase
MPFAASARPGEYRLAVLCLAGLLLWFGMLGLRPLFNPDEGRYAEIPREMLASGDFVLPRLDGIVYLEKPPLQYWLSALGLRALGKQPFAARLVPALAASATLVAVFVFARRLWGRPRAYRAVLMAASMPLFVFLGQLLTLDMLLCFWLVFAVLAFCTAQELRGESPARARRWMLLCWVAMAAATLTKGLVGLLIPGAVLVVYSLMSRDWQTWRELALARGLLLYGAIVTPWCVLVERAHPGALYFLVVHEHFERYLTTVHQRYQPWWFFLPILAAGVLPWLPQALRAVLTGHRRTRPVGCFDSSRVLWIAVLFIVVFYSASGSKLAPYVLPCLPLLAVLAAGQDEAAFLNLRLGARAAVALAILLGLLLVIYPFIGPSDDAWAIYRSVAPYLAGAATLIGGGGILALSGRVSEEASFVVLAASHFAAALMLATLGASRLDWKYSGAALAAPVAAAAPGTPVYAFKTFDWTLPFYTGIYLVPVAYRGELDYGLRAEPGRGIESLADFRTSWRAAPAALALVEPRELPGFAALGLPYRELTRTPQHVLVSRR